MSGQGYEDMKVGALYTRLASQSRILEPHGIETLSDKAWSHGVSPLETRYIGGIFCTWLKNLGKVLVIS